MKTLSLRLDLKELPALPANLKEKSASEIVVVVIKSAVLNWGSAKRGLDEDERAVYTLLCNDFGRATKEGKGEVVLEGDRIKLIEKTYKGNHTPDDLFMAVEVLVQEMLRSKDSAEAK